MFALHPVVADTVLMTGNIFGYHFTITTATLVYWFIAAIVGFVAESLVGWRLPFGIVGAILAALLGIWLMTNIFRITISNDPIIYGIPLLRALIGAVLLVALWHLITYRAWRRRPRRRTA